MGWKSKVARRYTDPQVKAMNILSKHGIIYVSEDPTFKLSDRRGDQVVCDIYLTAMNDNVNLRDVRVECDSTIFHARKRDEEADEDMRLLEQYGVRTVRLDNRRIMLKSGERYIMDKLGKNRR